jgi:hypothetical protein
MVDVRPIDQEDPVSGFIEVFKYAVKFSDQTPADTYEAWQTLAGKRLLGSAGCFRGVEVPESLLDDSEGLAELPYVQLFYRFFSGAGGYSLLKTSQGVEPAEKKRVHHKSEAPKKPSYTKKQFLAAYQKQYKLFI